MKIFPFGFLLLSCISYGETVLFQDNFDGSPNAVLNARTPDVGTAAWVAGEAFKADGTVQGSVVTTATLAFVPMPGTIYQLDVRFDCTSSGTEWIGAGFSEGQSAENNIPENGFVQRRSAQTIGKAWAILKGDPVASQPNGNTAHTYGSKDGLAFADGLEYATGELDIRIILNTKGEMWTAAWHAKEVGATEYKLVRPVMELQDKTISSVGLVTRNGEGRFSHFMLKTLSGELPHVRAEQEPEPLNILFQDNFDGAASPLNNRSPNVGAAKWMAAPSFRGNGSIREGEECAAALPFFPTAGNVYQLDVRFDCISTGTKWLGAGFAIIGNSGKGRYVLSGKSQLIGQAWAILKGDPAFTEPNGNTAHAQGTINGMGFQGGLEEEVGTMDVRIILNTEGTIWTAEWYAKKATDSEYTLVRPTTNLPDKTINAVGLLSNAGEGRIDQFTLRSTASTTLVKKPARSRRPEKKPKAAPAPAPAPAPVIESKSLGLITT